MGGDPPNLGRSLYTLSTFIVCAADDTAGSMKNCRACMAGARKLPDHLQRRHWSRARIICAESSGYILMSASKSSPYFTDLAGKANFG